MKNRKLILILVVFSFILLCDSKTLTFNEKNLTPLQIITYSDNSVIFRLVERLNDTCNVPNLTYRILYPNGTNNIITVYDHNHQIPHYNFCTVNPENLSEIQIIDNLEFYKTITNYIFVTYNNFLNENNTISTFGMMIDWNGKIIR